MKLLNQLKGYFFETVFDAVAGNFVERQARNPDFSAGFKDSGESVLKPCAGVPQSPANAANPDLPTQHIRQH
jgi:hypothetical protein